MELYDSKFVYFDWDDKLKGKKGFFGDSINHIKLNVKDNRTIWFGEICHNTNANTDYPFAFIDESDNSHCFRFCYYDPHYEFRRAYLYGKQIQFKDSTGNWRDVEGEPIFARDEYRIKPEWYIVLDDYGLSRINSKKDGDVLFEGTEEECIRWLEEHKKFENIMLAWKYGNTIQYNSGDGWEDCCDNKPAWDVDVKYRVEPKCKDDHKVAVRYVPFETLDEFIHKWEGMNPGCTNRPKCAMPMIWIKDKNSERTYLIIGYEPNDNRPIKIDTRWYSFEDLFEYFTFLDGSVIGKVKRC